MWVIWFEAEEGAQRLPKNYQDYEEAYNLAREATRESGLKHWVRRNGDGPGVE